MTQRIIYCQSNDELVKLCAALVPLGVSFLADTHTLEIILTGATEVRIIPNTFAVFWSPPGSTSQFHADVRALSPAAAVSTFRIYFPGDIIRSVRGADGRFTTFKRH